MSPVKQISLRDVIEKFERRLGVAPLKHYWREETNSVTNNVDCKGCELSFTNLTPAQVKDTMEGIPLIEKKKFKHRAYRWLYRWEMKAPNIQFRCTLYIYDDERQHFIFTTTW